MITRFKEYPEGNLISQFYDPHAGNMANNLARTTKNTKPISRVKSVCSDRSISMRNKSLQKKREIEAENTKLKEDLLRLNNKIEYQERQ